MMMSYYGVPGKYAYSLKVKMGKLVKEQEQRTLQSLTSVVKKTVERKVSGINDSKCESGARSSH